ncbi:sll0787 family AIR synthase-like protein [Acidisoma cellulosilytica]|uniref:Sll0787 family AIR synthase-like protein n=1 Tax=Acidisoma cellulosilyticum TaxID=2802395 RepID=A0A963Z0V3_9PROT|nr:sll0787 family AIR synthase-like protein [Acidisoma cellulosilyticum]MCB8879788.1 sll0787 family AIR synthase-like protein [Acidisoma cellulosilyticum]
MLTQSLAQSLRNLRGLAHKTDIAAVARHLGKAPEGIRLGDDCAAIPDGDGFLLLAIEGFVPDFLKAEPWFAGWCGVMVNASDIAAMGGRPIAVVDALWSAGNAEAEPVLAGLKAAADAYRIPVIGGHTNARASSAQLAVAILGRATKLLTSFDAKPGEVILAAIDLRGAYHDPLPYWDAATRGADAERLRGDLDTLAQIAESGLSKAAKDISMAGLVGTALMLAECSGIGMLIDPLAVPRPEGVALDRWLSSFPSFGFILTATADKVPGVIAAFAGRGIACAAIGQCTPGTKLDLLNADGTTETFWDLADAPLIGCAPI